MVPSHCPDRQSSGNAETGPHLRTSPGDRVRSSACGGARGTSPRPGLSFRPTQFCYPTPRTTAGCQSRVARHATSGPNPGVGEVGRGWGWGRGGLCLELNSVLSVRSGGGRLCRAARLETEGPRRAAGPGRAGAGLWARRRRQRSHTAQHLAHSLSSCLPGVLAAACWHPRQVSRVKSSTTAVPGHGRGFSAFAAPGWGLGGVLYRSFAPKPSIRGEG